MKRIVILLLLICLAKFAGAQTLRRTGPMAVSGHTESKVPKLTGRVNDYAGILSERARVNLERELKAHEDSTPNQVVVLPSPRWRTKAWRRWLTRCSLQPAVVG